MAKNFSVYSISDTLLKEIKGAIRSVTGSESVERSVQKGLVKKISASKKRKVKK